MPVAVVVATEVLRVVLQDREDPVVVAL